MKNSVPSPYFSLVLPPTIPPADLETCVAGICEVLDTSAPERYELIIIDDNANGIASIAESLTPIYRQLRVVRSKNPAVSAGWEAATGDVLSILDGDLSQKPTSLNQLVATIEEGADLVVLGQYAKIDTTKTDNQTVGCLAIRKDCLTCIDDSPQGNKILRDILGEETFQRIREDFVRSSNTSARWQHFIATIKHLLRK